MRGLSRSGQCGGSVSYRSVDVILMGKIVIRRCIIYAERDKSRPFCRPGKRRDMKQQ